MTSIMSQAWKVVKPHMPLIRFKKGGKDNLTLKPAEAPQAGSSTPNERTSVVQQRALIEDYQLPLRYRRQPLDEKEIDAINSGGAY